ncbi:MAG: DUF4445 domain-containing protein [Opitutales bacterium]|nr:DUF4445 domain-containing protein [Opitutales bacterium]
MDKNLSINSRSCQAVVGKSLFQLAEGMGLAVPTSCNQQGKCHECLMEVSSGMDCLTHPAEQETRLKEGFRLSCLCKVIRSDGHIQAHTLNRGKMQIEDKAVFLPGTSKRPPLDPALRREGNEIRLDGDIVDRGKGPILGVAIDLGTTTVALRVLDLESGKLLASAAFENPQRFGGSDVMARIQYDTDHPGRQLQRTLLAYLRHSLEQMPIDTARIFEFVIAANPTMRDLFFGLNVHSIGQKPYRSITESEWRSGKRKTTALTRKAASLQLPSHPQARVYGLPLIGGHVGGDASACLLAIEPHRRKELTAIMDLGTNTELILGNQDRLMVASCPAGPAFEGRGIACGMAGVEGAIARVRYEDANASWQREVIGNGPAQGICGSGLIDLVSELLRTDQMDSFGRFGDGAERVVIDSRYNVFLHKSDINQLAQAKGANVAGLRIVAQQYGKPFAEWDHFYLAGGFGRHLNATAASNMGLIPNLPVSKIQSPGNLSIEGATIALLSMTKRHEIEALVPTIQHIELETDPQFFDHFVEGCQFGILSNELEDLP